MDVKPMVVAAGCTAKTPYEFQVHNDEDEKNPITVKLVMPLGGEMSGLYRSPKKDEKVLVMQVAVSGDTYNYYLMGYLPCEADGKDRGQIFFEGKSEAGDFIENEGEVFRYKKLGSNSKNGEYSEIGFYKKEDDSESVEKGKNAPTIDEINVLSTGNIVIEAAKDITLKVGRSSITISDSGISMKNQLMRFIPNPADATISMNARAGISIAGETVGINADYKWSIGEKFGASVAGTAGSLNMGGREIKASSPTWSSQLAGNIIYLTNEIAKITAGGCALTSSPDESKVTQAEIGGVVLSMLAHLTDAGAQLYGVYKRHTMFEAYNTATGYDKANPNKNTNPVSIEFIDLGGAFAYGRYELVALAYGMVMEIAETIYGRIKDIFEDDQLDQFNYSTMIINNSLTLAFTSAMLLNGLHLGSASLSIEYDGSMLIKTAKDKKLYAESVTTGAAPVPMLAKWQAMTAGAAVVTSKVSELVNIGYDIQDIIDKNKDDNSNSNSNENENE